MNSPIIIAAVPRSGSSLIAGIFAAHGVWCGDFSKKVMSNTPIPYDSYENDEINEWFKPDSDIELNEIVPKDKRWFYKCSPSKAKKILQMLTNPVCIKVKRKTESILKSSSQKAHIQALRKKQIESLDSMDGLWISSDEVINGDFNWIRSVFATIGLVFDENAANKVINKALWHHE